MTGKDAENILTSGFVHTIKDPLWGNIPIESGMRALLSIPAVEKLSRIKQNGPAYRIYPGAVHTRLSHSIGVYHIGRRMLAEAAMKGHELPFSECGMKSFLAACLLHDIGHFPYAHSLKELSPKTHEEIASELIADDRKLRDAVIATGADPQITGAIINTSIPSGDAEILFYRHVLSGTLDPDKLDYLSRDAFFAGVPYGKQDTDFIISSLSYADSSLVLNEEALSLVEQVLFSKYMMYRSLYWHKGVRSATCMIKKAIISSIDENIITFDALYLKDDDEFRRITERYPSFKPFSLIDEAEHGRLFERKAMRNFDENGNPVYYATTSDIYVYWRMVSKDWVKLSLKATQLVNINDSADTIGWTMKVLGTWGEGNDSSLSTDLSGGWTVDGGTKRIHSNEGSSTCWGCVRFECTTAKVSDKSGSYDAILTLILEANS